MACESRTCPPHSVRMSVQSPFTGKDPACPSVILLFAVTWHRDPPQRTCVLGIACCCPLVLDSPTGARALWGKPCWASGRGQEGAYARGPGRPQKFCSALFSSSRHSEVGVCPSRAVPREEFWDHHLSMGGAHGCPHALCGAQPGAGTPASAGSPQPRPLCPEAVWPPGGSSCPHVTRRQTPIVPPCAFPAPRAVPGENTKLCSL